MISKNKLKQLEERVERVVEDPEKLIHLITQMIELACRTYESPVPDDQKVEFWQFVKYFGNMHLENTLQDDKHQADAKKFVTEIEEAIRKNDGFLTYELPEGLVIKYK